MSEETTAVAVPKLGQIVFVRVVNPNNGYVGVEPAIVTETYDASDGEWSQGGKVVNTRSFGFEGVDTFVQCGPAEYDSNGVWSTGYALTPDGPEVESLKSQGAVPASQNYPTGQGGVSAADVQSAISANNTALLAEIAKLVQPAASQDKEAQPVAVPLLLGTGQPDSV